MAEIHVIFIYSSIIRYFLVLKAVFKDWIIIFSNNLIPLNPMLYQLPNGKVIEISTEQYIQLSDEELEYLIAYNYGDLLEDPWFGSILSKPSNDIDVDLIVDILDVPDDEKLDDLDVDFDPEEE